MYTVILKECEALSVDKTLFGLSTLSLVISILQFLYPLQFWKVIEGWRYKDGSEPTDVFLALSKFGAFIGILMSLAGYYNAFH